MPQGGSFPAPFNNLASPGVLSYLISTKSATLTKDGDANDAFVKARMFLGNSLFAGVRLRYFPVLPLQNRPRSCILLGLLYKTANEPLCVPIPRISANQSPCLILRLLWGL